MNQKKTAQKNYSRMLCIIGVMLVLVSVALLRDPAPAAANSEEGDLPGIQYPVMDGTRIDHCNFCHTPDGLRLNLYGEDYMAQGGHKRGPEAFTAIEQLDSDDDGLTNLEEILALTNPGDPASRPFVIHKLPKDLLPRLPTLFNPQMQSGPAGGDAGVMMQIR